MKANHIKLALACLLALTAATGRSDDLDEKARLGQLCVYDFGAKGDGVTDDTAAIQAGIDYLARRGGGRLYFPYATNGYLIASPGREYAANGRLVRAQLVIPPGICHNISLVGEMPCKHLYSYQIRLPQNPRFRPTSFGDHGFMNVILHSTWDAPEVHDPKSRPWAVIAAPEGDLAAGCFSVKMFSIFNLEIRAHLNKDKMYPTTSAANLQNVARLVIQDSQFCIDDSVGDHLNGKELQENPCHTAGLIASGDQDDIQIFRNVASQGFKYGYVFGEHTTAEHLYVHNTEYAICFVDSTHPSIINRVVAQHNQRYFCALPDGTFGRKANLVNLIVNEADYETGFKTRPLVSRMRYGVWDPENRFRGSIVYLQGFPGTGKCYWPIEGGKNICCRALGVTPDDPDCARRPCEQEQSVLPKSEKDLKVEGD